MKATITLLLAGSVVLAIACSGVEPNVPTVVGVTLTTSTTTPPLPASASIKGSGDSAVAIVVTAATCGKTPSADAALSAGRLIITITLTAFAPQTCDPIFGSTTYRAVAHGLAPGTYHASVDYRYVFGTTISDSTMARATITLP